MKSILNFDPASFSKEVRRLKRKFYLLFVLPVILVILAVRVLQVYLSIVLRKAGTSCPKETVIPKPVKKTVIKPQFVTPEPVSQPVK